MRWLILTVALLASSSVNALDEKYKFCALTGWFYGGKDNFTGDLAQYKINDPFGSVCQAVWKDAYERGEAFSRGGKVQDETDRQLMVQGYEFKLKIMKFILNGAGY